jgi:hypothetical protein
MLNPCRYTCFIVCIAILLGSSLIAQADEYASVTGTITNQKTRTPVAGVNVILAGTRLGASTNDEGVFQIARIPAGEYTLEFTHINYLPYSLTYTFTAGSTTTIDVEMVSRPIMLEEVEVVDTVRRWITSRGYYYSREDIERTAAATFGQLLQSLVPRARIRETAGNLYIQLQRRSVMTGRFHRVRDPYPLIIIDGMRIGTSPIGLSGIAHPDHIESFEVIRPPEAESFYGSEAEYGAIIIETIDRSDEEPVLTPVQRMMLAGGFIGLIAWLLLR